MSTPDKITGVCWVLIAGSLLPGAQRGSADELGPPPRWAEGLPRASPPLATPSSLAVDAGNRQEVVDFYREVYLASVGVPIEWNGNTTNCLAGTNSTAFAAATLLRVNYFRAMAGLPANVVLDADRSAKCQEAALMMSAQGRLSHHPDPSWPCYTEEGAEAAGRSNLYHGRDGPGAIDGYMDDWGGINYPVGHRRWILYPPQRTMGTGSIPLVGGRLGANALWVLGGFGARPSEPEWVAWPPPGYVPTSIMPRVSGRWSFSLAGADFTQATVSVACSGTNVPVRLESLENGKGYGDNTLVWIPEGVPTTPPAEDIGYRVTLTEVFVDNRSRSFEYTVTLIDPDRPAPGEPPVIEVPPQDLAVVEGADVQFTVVASGTEPLTYLWRFDEEILVGATNATLTLLNVSMAQAGTYRVEVGNPVGHQTSDPAHLTVQPRPPPRFDSVMVDQGTVTVNWSGDAILQVAQAVTGPWTDLPGVRSPFSTLADGPSAFYRLVAAGQPLAGNLLIPCGPAHRP